MQTQVILSDRAYCRSRLQLSPSARAPDKRIAPRKAARVPGFLHVPERFELVPCRIADFSATGARVILEDSDWKPTRCPLSLTLVIPLDRTEVECMAMWCLGQDIGLTFQSGYRNR